MADGQSEEEQRALRESERFVVGIGSSAGGLEAIRELMKNVSPDVNATYVVVQHMSPQHRSLLTKLIGRETDLEVVDIESGVWPEPGKVYVTPPNHDLLYEEGVLCLVDPSTETAAPKPSVDRFFISLAEGAGERAVGVILSGTGSDGSYGVQAIRVAGGITIAQTDVSAKYDGMPMAAVETGCVDLVLSPLEIGTHLSKILSKPRNFEQFRADDLPDTPTSDLLQILLARTRVDFREYKPTTVIRRIERRMNALGIEHQSEYTAFCRSNPREVDALFKDLLISVTRFFRDSGDFEMLTKQIEELIEERKGAGLRVWVTGCATGEEVYSIAILLAEALGGVQSLSRNNVQLFATDIDRDALARARAGHYSVTALNDVPPEYHARYFVRHEDTVQVHKALRDVVLFSEHNVCQDPPFLNIDLICCRNVLIYFGSTLQRKVLMRMHYALNDNGILFLGAAETVSGSEDMFWSLSPKHPVFRRRQTATRRFERGGAGRYEGIARATQRNVPMAPDPREERERSMFEGLARAVGPDALLVSNDLRIHKVFGDVSNYVSISESTKLAFSLTMLHRPLDQEARTLVSLALKNRAPRDGLEQSLEGGDGKLVRMTAYPIGADSDEQGMALLVFKSHERTETKPALTEDIAKLSSDEATAYIRKLEHEVETMREALQQTVEQLETANEELQSLNEELQSTNEELQATNEELETSNEELQSTNEELVTVNEELQVNAAELSAMSDELASVLENIGTSVLVVDSALQISHASKDAEKMFKLSAPFERPHLSQCEVPTGFPNLPEVCNESLHLGKTVRREFASEKVDYVLSCAPYSDNKGRLAGAAIVFMAVPGTKVHAQ